MVHGNKLRKFGRKRKVRNALMESLAVALITQKKIRTTEAKAKSLRPFIEKIVTTGKGKTLAAERKIIAAIGVTSARKIMNDIAPKYKERSGGYTRITKLPRRASDAAKMAVIEFV